MWGRRGLGVAIAFGFMVSFSRNVSAEVAAPAEMERVCRNWLSYIVHETGGWAGVPMPEIVRVEDFKTGDTVLARCYSIAPRGYVVRSGVLSVYGSGWIRTSLMGSRERIAFP